MSKQTEMEEEAYCNILQIESIAEALHHERDMIEVSKAEYVEFFWTKLYQKIYKLYLDK